jgi:lipoprotein-anchoring transpeptidase ErfK/SrfK
MFSPVTFFSLVTDLRRGLSRRSRLAVAATTVAAVVLAIGRLQAGAPAPPAAGAGAAPEAVAAVVVNDDTARGVETRGSEARGVAVDPAHPEGRFVRAIVAMREGRAAEALREIDAAIALAPNFQLAHMVRGDLLLARGGRLSPRLESFGQMPLIDLEREARARLSHYDHGRHESEVPSSIVRLAPEQKHALVVDIGENRLYVYRSEGGEPRYVTDYYVTTGRDGASKSEEGDARTPVGVYQIVSALGRRKLADFYGSGAFPLSYPNEWDRKLGRQGHGIWLHGVPHDSYSRPPQASNGCVVLANRDLDSLARMLEIGSTPVVIAEHVEWKSPTAARIESEALLRALSKAGSPDNVLGDSRVGPGVPIPAARARSVMVGFTPQGAQPPVQSAPRFPRDDTVGVFRYPGAERLMLVTYDRSHAADDGRHVGSVHQYWSYDKDNWKILYETQ